ncbi:Os10g0481000 [Oryza sativa Japonica Group]|uniref:Os10g0481000 protein n=1 Tax=Oryza sativa subsp. japonica TaxID=39947 RepID=A0A0P0XVF5_ORYSJ|nr:Os10g0481000 [Oryza sativa Japonica Group]
MPPPPHNPPAVFWRFPYKLTRCLDPSGSAVDTYAHPPRPLPSKPNPNPPTLIHFTPPSRYKIPPKLNPTLNSKPKPPHTLRFFFPFHFFLLLLRCFRFSLERRVCDGRAERWRRGDVDGRGAPAVRAAAAAARGGGGGAGRGGGYMGDVVGVVVARGGVPARWWRPADACGGGVVEGREGEARWRRRRGGEGGRWWRWGRCGGGGVAAGEHPRLVEDPRHGVRRQGERGRSAARWPSDERGGDEECRGGLGWVPPHELLLCRERAAASFSVREGAGRTLKGRDLRRVRNAIWEKTGFQD